MAVRGHKEAMKGLRDFADGTEKHIEKTVDDVVLQAAEKGEDRIREVIDSTPSDLSRIPKGHRNWTFTMRNSVDSDVQHRGRKRKVVVGWLGKRQRYFLTQEYGGSLRGKHISAMRSLQASVETVKSSVNIGLVAAGIRRV